MTVAVDADALPLDEDSRRTAAQVQPWYQAAAGGTPFYRIASSDEDACNLRRWTAACRDRDRDVWISKNRCAVTSYRGFEFLPLR